jgi:hypothetical protein
MESATFRKWLAERGCQFEPRRRARGKAPGIAAVTVRRGDRKVELPLIGSRKRLSTEVVHAIVDGLGLDRSELPGPQGRV